MLRAIRPPGDGSPSRAASRLPRLLLGAALLATPVAGLTSCSIKRMAVNSVANSLTSGPDVFGTDDDPQLIRDAIPFGLKTIEGLLAQSPKHKGLLFAACAYPADVRFVPDFFDRGWLATNACLATGLGALVLRR